MQNDFFLSLESIAHGDEILLRDCLSHLQFNSDGLIPVITQCVQTKEILMHAWMNRQAIEQTLKTKKMTYWSRSRNCFWIKGESSGNTQELINFRIDCDGDTLLCQVNQIGPACHTGRPNCFYLQANSDTNTVSLHTPTDKL